MGGNESERREGEKSLWMATSPETAYEALDGGLTVDTAIVGGGIVGLTAASLLSEAGQSVAVVERDRIVEGVSGRTTAKVTSQHGLIYAELKDSFGRRRARQYAAANQAAVEHVADRVDERGIDCDLRRLPSYTFVESAEKVDRVRDEVRAARDLGLPASYEEDLPDIDGAAAAVRFDDQAQFHPRKYLLSLAAEIDETGGHVLEHTRALRVDDGSPCSVETERGDIRADSVILATHFPMVDHGLFFARMYPKRSYVVAVDAADPPRGGIYYRTGSPYFSARTHETPEGTLTLVGGQNHKTGHGGSTAERYRRVEQEARERFDVRSVEYRWSTQDYVSVDNVPYVGEAGPFIDNVYVATGFGGWGMSNGVAAGMVLSDRILDRGNPWTEVFHPRRLGLRASAETFARENADVAGEFVGNWLTKPRRRPLRNLAHDEATVLRNDGDVLGVYRDEDGDLHTVSAVCPHMHCLVEWNDGERTWDCPCHGSRFGYDGHVIDGPSVSDLPTRSLGPE